MAPNGLDQREAEDLVNGFLEEGCLSEGAASRVVELLDDERYIDSLEIALRNL